MTSEVRLEAARREPARLLAALVEAFPAPEKGRWEAEAGEVLESDAVL